MVDFSKINIDLDGMPGFYLHLFIETDLAGTKTYFARLCSKKGLPYGCHFSAGLICSSYGVRPCFLLREGICVLSFRDCSFFVDQGSVEGLKIWLSENLEESLSSEATS